MGYFFDVCGGERWGRRGFTMLIGVCVCGRGVAIQRLLAFTE